MKAISEDKARLIDIYSRKDGSFDRTCRFINAEDQSAFALAGYIFELMVCLSSHKTPLMILTEGAGLTTNANTLRIEIDYEDLIFKKQDLIYFLWVTTPEGKRQVWLNGRFVVNHDLFDDIESTEDVNITLTGGDIVVQINFTGENPAAILLNLRHLADINLSLNTDVDQSSYSLPAESERWQFLFVEQPGYLDIGFGVQWIPINSLLVATFPNALYNQWRLM